jgi:hypothetical protein
MCAHIKKRDTTSPNLENEAMEGSRMEQTPPHISPPVTFTPPAHFLTTPTPTPTPIPSRVAILLTRRLIVIPGDNPHERKYFRLVDNQTGLWGTEQ